MGEGVRALCNGSLRALGLAAAPPLPLICPALPYGPEGGKGGWERVQSPPCCLLEWGRSWDRVVKSDRRAPGTRGGLRLGRAW